MTATNRQNEDLLKAVELVVDRMKKRFRDVRAGPADRLACVDTVIKVKLMESKILLGQAPSNTKEQFPASPDLDTELLGAVMAALDAHNTMSTQALNSDKVRAGLKAKLANDRRVITINR